jgi:hypothetical protein
MRRTAKPLPAVGSSFAGRRVDTPGTQVPEGTVVHRAWMIEAPEGGRGRRRWGAVVLTVPGEGRARCHICFDDPGHGLRASRTRGDDLKLIESAQAKALKISAAMDVPIRRYGGGTLQQFQEWFRAKEEEESIPTPPSDDYLEEFQELLR